MVSIGGIRELDCEISFSSRSVDRQNPIVDQPVKVFHHWLVFDRVFDYL
jgi:hypothetical protein